MKLIPLGVAGVLLTLGLTACGSGSNSSVPAPTATVTVTAPASPTPSETPTTEAFVAQYNDVNSYVNDHLPPGFPIKGAIYDNNRTLDSSYMNVCNQADGAEPSSAFRRSFVRGLVKTKLSGIRLTAAQGGVLFDTIVAGCYDTGHATKLWVFNAKDYKYGDVLSALNKAGFDDFIKNAKTPDTVGATCKTISGQKRGSLIPRSERADWVDILSGYDDGDWGWTKQRATKFVDTLFDACYATGRSKPYVPPVPTIGEGVWTVGKDVPVGTYRSDGAFDDYGCYWEISRSGSNGDDIISNDIVNGGYPTVTLSEGQDFKSQGCGTWTKVG